MKRKIMLGAFCVVVAVVVATIIDLTRPPRGPNDVADSENGRRDRDIRAMLDLTDEQEQQRLALAEDFPGGMRNPEFRAEFEKILSDEQRETWRERRERFERSRGSRSGEADARERIWRDLNLSDVQEDQRTLLLMIFPEGLDDSRFCLELEALLTPEQSETLVEGLEALGLSRRFEEAEVSPADEPPVPAATDGE